MRLLIFVSVLFLLLTGCDESTPEVAFENPQPIDIPNEKGFGRRIQGIYLKQEFHSVNANSYIDSTFLSITPHLIIRQHNLLFKAHRDEINLPDSINRKDNQLVIAYGKEEGFQKVYFVGDTLFAFAETKDTIFHLTDRNVLRFYKGAYFLNTPLRTGGWEVTRAKFNGNHLAFSNVYATDSTTYEEITPVRIIKTGNDSVYKQEVFLNPTRKELRKLVQEDWFITESVYKKIK